jgi:2-polyprenyl-3-methyl-5-hydroxy-6-metoxy-1,4-benzoquinol methylase
MPNASETLLPFLLDPPFEWQMKFGERCALEGLLSLLKPQLAIEIGTAQGGSLQRVAAHSREVHSFDVADSVAQLSERFDNVEAHIGDSAELLPRVLEQLASQGRNVDFALVDGDHSAEGIQRDMRALLDAEACGSTVVVAHDSANDEVRRGLDGLSLEEHPRVALVMLDFVPGYVVAAGPRRFEIWNGLALVVVDAAARGETAARDDEVFPAAALNRRMRDILRADAQDRHPSPPVEEPSARQDSRGLSNAADGIPERFVPDEMGEGLVAAEHLSRYWWAAHFASGRRILDAGCGIGYGSNILAAAGGAAVVGVDLSAPVIEAARSGAHPAVALEVGDVASLDFDDDSFDLVVCFEVIEHVQQPERVFDELARVLAPDGLLLVSSPNPRAYVPGNPHHVHEFLPEELESAMAARLPNVRLMRQHEWLASAVLGSEAFASTGDQPLTGVEVRKLLARDPGSEMYTLAMGSRTELPNAASPVTLTGTIEFRDWMENYHSQDRVLREQADEIRRLQTLNEERRQLRWQLEEAEAKLTILPELEHRANSCQAQLAVVSQSLEDIKASPSWRMTAPLRNVKGAVRRLLSS